MKIILSLAVIIIISFLLVVLKKNVFTIGKSEFENSKEIFKKDINDFKNLVYENFSFNIEGLRQNTKGYFITLSCKKNDLINHFVNYNAYFAEKKFNVPINRCRVLIDGEFKKKYKDSTLQKKIKEFYNLNKDGAPKNFKDFITWLQ